MVPAILRIFDSTKKHELEILALLRMRDIRAIACYGHYLRPESDSEFLFLDSNGEPIKKVCTYIAEAGKSQGIKGLTTNLMRSLAETSTLGDDLENSVASHLGHSKSTRDRHYSFPDDKVTIQVTSRLLAQMEKEGEEEILNEHKSFPIDPVRYKSVHVFL